MHFLPSLLSKGNEAHVVALCQAPFLSSSQRLSSLCANSAGLEQDEGPGEALPPRPVRPEGCTKGRDLGQCLLWAKSPQRVLSSYPLHLDCLLADLLMILRAGGHLIFMPESIYFIHGSREGKGELTGLHRVTQGCSAADYVGFSVLEFNREKIPAFEQILIAEQRKNKTVASIFHHIFHT